MSAEQRHAFRLEKSFPLMNELGKWIVKTYKATNPKSPMASQLPLENWYEVIGDETIADAFLDRLVHSSYRKN